MLDEVVPLIESLMKVALALVEAYVEASGSIMSWEAERRDRQDLNTPFKITAPETLGIATKPYLLWTHITQYF